MVKKKANNTKFIIIIVLLLIFSIYITFSYNNIENKYNNLTQKYRKLNYDYNNLKKDYNNLNNKLAEKNNQYIELTNKYDQKASQLESLKQNYNKLETEKTNINQDYNNLAIKYSNLVNDLNTFKTQIKSSMEWFKTNSKIDILKDTQKHTIKVSLNDCVICNSKSCKIKLACINHKNNNVLRLEYSEDKIITNKKDKLQSLTSFIENRKGDCEDFSLLFSAQLRYIKNNLIEDDKKIIIEPIVFTDTTKKYFIDKDKEWYYENGVEGIEFNDYIYPYVACGESYDPNSKQITGHCLNIVSKNEINDFNDLENIDAIAIEPQTGQFIGKLNQDIEIKNNNYSIYLINKLKQKKPLQNIYLIITKDNLIYNQKGYFYNQESKWQSYKLYLEKIKSLESIN